MQTTITTPITETYLDVEKLIHHICNLFRLNHGGDFDEMVGEANLIYMKVYEKWRRGRGSKFTSYLCTSIYRRLLDLKRISIRKSKIWNTSINDFERENARSVDDLSIMEDKKSQFDTNDFFEELTADARVILQFALEEPKELKEKVIARGGHNRRNWKTTIKEYLKEIGWTARRITESFEEIRRAL